MATDDFFRARLDQMIDLRHPLALLADRLPWPTIEAALAWKFALESPAPRSETIDGLFGPELVTGDVGRGGRPRLPIRLMAGLLYLKNSFDLSDEELVQRWAENVYFQHFCGMAYFEPRLPCDATQIGRFRRAIGEDGMELLLKATIETAVDSGAIKPQEIERVIVDSTVQEKAVAYPTDSRLLEIARHKLVSSAKRLGLALKQTFAHEGASLRRRAGGYAHAKQFKRLKKVLRRQRTIVGIVIREIRRKLAVRLQPGVSTDAQAPNALTLTAMNTWLERAERIRSQQPKSKNKLYAMHAPEVECISKGKARQPYEFGVKVGLAVTHKSGLMVGARTFPGNPYDGHTLAEQLEQVRNLCQDIGVVPTTAVVDLGYRGVDADNPGVQIIHRGKFKSLTALQRRWLKRRQAIEPAIGHTKADHRMGRCWLHGASGDALHALSCALGYNIRWLMRALHDKARRALLRLLRVAAIGGEKAMVAVHTAVARLIDLRWRGSDHGVWAANAQRVGLAVA